MNLFYRRSITAILIFSMPASPLVASGLSGGFSLPRPSAYALAALFQQEAFAARATTQLPETSLKPRGITITVYRPVRLAVAGAHQSGMIWIPQKWTILNFDWSKLWPGNWKKSGGEKTTKPEKPKKEKKSVESVESLLKTLGEKLAELDEAAAFFNTTARKPYALLNKSSELGKKKLGWDQNPGKVKARDVQQAIEEASRLLGQLAIERTTHESQQGELHTQDAASVVLEASASKEKLATSTPEKTASDPVQTAMDKLNAKIQELTGLIFKVKFPNAGLKTSFSEGITTLDAAYKDLVKRKAEKKPRKPVTVGEVRGQINVAETFIYDLQKYLPKGVIAAQAAVPMASAPSPATPLDTVVPAPAGPAVRTPAVRPTVSPMTPEIAAVEKRILTSLQIVWRAEDDTWEKRIQFVRRMIREDNEATLPQLISELEAAIANARQPAPAGKTTTAAVPAAAATAEVTYPASIQAPFNKIREILGPEHRTDTMAQAIMGSNNNFSLILNGGKGKELIETLIELHQAIGEDGDQYVRAHTTQLEAILKTKAPKADIAWNPPKAEPTAVPKAQPAASPATTAASEAPSAPTMASGAIPSWPPNVRTAFQAVQRHLPSYRPDMTRPWKDLVEESIEKFNSVIRAKRTEASNARAAKNEENARKFDEEANALGKLRSALWEARDEANKSGGALAHPDTIRKGARRLIWWRRLLITRLFPQLFPNPDVSWRRTFQDDFLPSELSRDARIWIQEKLAPKWEWIHFTSGEDVAEAFARSHGKDRYTEERVAAARTMAGNYERAMAEATAVAAEGDAQMSLLWGTAPEDTPGLWMLNTALNARDHLNAEHLEYNQDHRDGGALTAGVSGVSNTAPFEKPQATLAMAQKPASRVPIKFLAVLMTSGMAALAFAQQKDNDDIAVNSYLKGHIWLEGVFVVVLAMGAAGWLFSFIKNLKETKKDHPAAAFLLGRAVMSGVAAMLFFPIGVWSAVWAIGAGALAGGTYFLITKNKNNTRTTPKESSPAASFPDLSKLSPMPLQDQVRNMLAFAQSVGLNPILTVRVTPNGSFQILIIFKKPVQGQRSPNEPAVRWSIEIKQGQMAQSQLVASATTYNLMELPHDGTATTAGALLEQHWGHVYWDHLHPEAPLTSGKTPKEFSFSA